MPAACASTVDSSEHDLVVVGGGIVGLAVAREGLLRGVGRSVVVLEKEVGVGGHQTAHNSGVVHAGIPYAPGSLKARLCVRGARELYEFCDRAGIEARRCGKVFVATRQEELPGLDELERRGRANGVPGLRRLAPRELAEVEPHVRGVSALHSPETGIVDFGAVAEALAREIDALGGTVETGVRVERLEARGTRRGSQRTAVRVAGQRELIARRVVGCAGAWSDRLARSSGAPADPRIVPFRGAYMRLHPERRRLVHALVYPVPDPRLPFLGVHLTRHADGEVLVGPTALVAGARDAYRLSRIRAADLVATASWPGSWRMARRWWRTGILEIRRALSPRALAAEGARLVPELSAKDLAPAFAGVRAQAVGRDGRLLDDFLFSEAGGALHVRNAPSPAATACLTIAREIVDRLERGEAT